jgi:proteic killer suppression protein
LLPPVTLWVTIAAMIKFFKHKGLKKLFETGHTSGVNPQHVERLRKILALLETAESIDDMDLPGLNLHNLKGKRKNTLAVNVSGNWRVTFKLKDGDVLEVNYEDYH